VFSSRRLASWSLAVGVEVPSCPEVLGMGVAAGCCGFDASMSRGTEGAGVGL
jgi:hypothetical protein